MVGIQSKDDLVLKPLSNLELAMVICVILRGGIIVEGEAEINVKVIHTFFVRRRFYIWVLYCLLGVLGLN